MTAWKTVSLAEAAELNPPLPRRLPAAYEVSFVPMSAVSAETAAVVSESTRTYAEVAKNFTPFIAGDVLVAKITPSFENGKIAQANLSRDVGFGSTEFHVVRPLKGKLDARYVLHFLRLGSVRKAGERRMTGSAGQRRVPENFLSSLKIPLPSISQQRRIADVLDRAEALRVQRRSALELLAKLTQSIFHELLRQAGKNLELVSIGDSMETIIDYRGKSPKKTEKGIPLITARVVKGGELLEPKEFIAEDEFEAWMRRGFPKTGDVLFTTEAPLGEVAQLDGRRVALAQRLVVLRGKPAMLDNTFLKYALTLQEVRNQIHARATGSTVRGIRQSELRKVRLPKPSIQSQREFARRIEAVEKLKAAQRASLAEMDALFASLQHRAFSGQL